MENQTFINRLLRLFKRTPRLIQMEAAECGAAAIGIILRYYGRFVPLETLREVCNVSRDGVNIYDMQRAAKYYGLKADVYECKLEDLKESSFPAIIYWKYNHFIVLEKFHNNRVYINDPSCGLKTITEKELSEGFSGLIIEFSKSKTFKEEGAPVHFFDRIKEKIGSFKNDLKYLFVIQAILALLGLATPVFSQIFIDKFFIPSMPDWYWNFLFLLFGIFLIMSIMSWIQGIFLNYFQARISIQLSTKFLAHLIRLPVFFFTQRYGNELINRMGLNTRIGEILTRDVAVNAFNLLLLSSYWVIMFSYNVMITVIAGFVALFNLAIVWFVGRSRMNDYARLQQAEAKAVGKSFDALKHIETMKGSGSDDFFFSRLASCYNENINTAQIIGKKDIWLTNLSQISQAFSSLVLLGIGGWQVMRGALTIGELFALTILFGLFLRPFTQIVQLSTEFQSVEVDLNRIDDVLNAQKDPIFQSKKKSEETKKLSGKIEFSQVDFSYQYFEKPFIRDFNLKIKRGEKIGFVGTIGSGKSTLTRLAAGLYHPKKGEILYDGLDFLEHSRETLSQSIAHVNQIILLFSGTIKDNLTLWDTSIPDEEIIHATKLACIHEDIIKLPDGYQTILQEEGLNFSQGQRQRLEIARALISKPTILILDEATNALDAPVEKEILDNVFKLKMTVILISHRLKRMKKCHRVLVLDEGEVVQLGPPKKLEKQRGLFKEMLKYEMKK